jgi:DNA (cytosine-5)-methyltransferase 1
VAKAIDLFSGAGGLTLGLMEAGFEVVAAVESDALAAKTYRLNHPDVRLEHADIRDIDPVELLEELGLESADLDLCAGCPPCQGFSSVRTLNGCKTVADPRNDLVSEYVRFVRELRPRAILMENVPGLLRDERFRAAAEELEDIGYPASEGARILNAADYGVPQNRRRLVLMCVRDRAVEAPPAQVERATVRGALGALGAPGESGDALHDLPECRSDRVMEMIRAIPEDGGGRLDLPEDQRLKCHKEFTGFKDVYGRMRWDSPAPTITGGCHNPSKGRFLHPKEHRAITLREAALLQGFPSDYRFALDRGKLAAAAMIGNAVPPPFVAAQAAALARPAGA